MVIKSDPAPRYNGYEVISLRLVLEGKSGRALRGLPAVDFSNQILQSLGRYGVWHKNCLSSFFLIISTWHHGSTNLYKRNDTVQRSAHCLQAYKPNYHISSVCSDGIPLLQIRIKHQAQTLERVCLRGAVTDFTVNITVPQIWQPLLWLSVIDLDVLISNPSLKPGEYDRYPVS